MNKTILHAFFWFVPFLTYVSFRIVKFGGCAALMKSGRVSRHVYYTAVCLGGFFYAHFAHGVGEIPAVKAVSSLFLINALFFSALLINNVFDFRIDETNSKDNTLERAGSRAHFALAAAGAAYGLLLSAFLSRATFLVTLTILFFSAAYSAPPLRLKRFFPINTMIIALCTVLSFLLGFYAFGSNHQPPRAFLFFLFAALSLSFNVKDINDAEGDKKYGVTTLMTLFGKKYGARAIAACAFAGYILFSLWQPFPFLIALSAAGGGATALLIVLARGKVNETAVFGVLAVYAAAYAAVFFSLYR